MSESERTGALERVLPFELALGDRIFLGVATLIFVHLMWLRYVGQEMLLVATAIGLVVLLAIVRWG